MQNNTMSKKKLVAIIIALVAVFVLALASIFLSRSGVRLTVEVSPSDATLQLDGKQIKPGAVTVSEGKHIFTISRQYFDTHTQEIDTALIDPKATIVLAPRATSKEAIQYLVDHPEEAAKFDQAGGYYEEITQRKIAATSPIVSKLPYETLSFRIDYSLDKDQNPSFLVTLFPVGEPGGQDYKDSLSLAKQEANDYFNENGVSVRDIKITYKTRE